MKRTTLLAALALAACGPPVAANPDPCSLNGKWSLVPAAPNSCPSSGYLLIVENGGHTVNGRPADLRGCDFDAPSDLQTDAGGAWWRADMRKTADRTLTGTYWDSGLTCTVTATPVP